MGLTFLFLIIAGVAKAWADALTDEQIKALDWTNKYDFTKLDILHWWYLGFYKPAYPEKFPFSSTILVFLTDRWHLSQFIMLRCFYAAITMSITTDLFWVLILIFVIFPVVLGVSFEAFYSCLRKYYKKIKK